MNRIVCCVALALLAFPLAAAQTKSDSGPKYDEKIFTGLELRNIGPALTSGRIIDLAVDPHDKRTWVVATAGGGV